MSIGEDAAIGVFDSGLGGLTVASAIVEHLPHENIVYLGDTARVPYGTRSGETVVRYARRNIAFLQRQGVKAVVVACNTVSAQGVESYGGGLKVPCLGVIEPGAQAAATATVTNSVAVLGTPATVRSQAYPRALFAIEPAIAVHQIACPLFVPLVEEGWLTHAVTESIVEEYLQPLRGADVDTVILGCTHYPLLAPPIKRVAERILGHSVAIVDSARALAQTLETLFPTPRLASPVVPTHRFFVTDAPDRVADVARRFWRHDTTESMVLEHIDLVDHGQ
ncbi:MAG: glutamate racemase [Myxococcota bacterium]|nr:glutamate racemase [Myxococcota bacterium]